MEHALKGLSGSTQLVWMALEGARADRPLFARPSDLFSDVRGRYDLITSNPPFHTGLKANFSITERMIAQAGGHLAPGGRLVIVANTFINYSPQLRRCFRDVNVPAESRRDRHPETEPATRRR